MGWLRLWFDNHAFIPNSVWNVEYYKIFCKLFLPSQIYLKAIFQYWPKHLTKNLHTACTPTELKQNLLHWPFFLASFVKLLDIKLDEYRLFLSHLKSDFLLVISSEQKRLY